MRSAFTMRDATSTAEGCDAIIAVMSAPLFGLPWLTLTIPLAFALACSVEGEDTLSTFGDPTNDPNSGGSGTGASDSDSTADSGTPPATDSGTPDPTTGPVATSDPTSDEGSSDGPPPENEQPASGMYSECDFVTDCIGQTTCVAVLGADAGFCSIDNCSDPAAQCVANPGATSTATPACVIDIMGASVCALECTGGATCPGGMECRVLGRREVCV